MRDLALLELLGPPAFARLAAICRDDPRFPASWDEWQELQTRAQLDAARAGVLVTSLDLQPEEFDEWCERVGIVPGLDALRAYAIVRRKLRNG